jgi:hypothetical protein
VKRRKAIIEVVVVAIVVISLFFGAQNLSLPRKQSTGNSGFYVGVECGYNNITLCKELIT